MKNHRALRRVLPLILLWPGLALAGQPSPATTQEIAYLFARLKTSGCEFNRNGSWYAADEASAHLNKKYDYLLGKGLIASAEDFIERAATQSSMSGQPYLVRCANRPPEPSGPWFRTALLSYRAGRR